MYFGSVGALQPLRSCSGEGEKGQRQRHSGWPTFVHRDQVAACSVSRQLVRVCSAKRAGALSFYFDFPVVDVSLEAKPDETSELILTASGLHRTCRIKLPSFGDEEAREGTSSLTSGKWVSDYSLVRVDAGAHGEIQTLGNTNTANECNEQQSTKDLYRDAGMEAVMGTLSCHIYLSYDGNVVHESYPHASGVKTCSPPFVSALCQQAGLQYGNDQRNCGLLVGGKSSGEVLLYSERMDQSTVLLDIGRQHVVHIDTLVGFGDSKQNNVNSVHADVAATPEAKASALLVVGAKGDVLVLCNKPKTGSSEGLVFQKYLLPHSDLSCAICVYREGKSYLVYASRGTCYVCQIAEQTESIHIEAAAAAAGGTTVVLRSWEVLDDQQGGGHHLTQVVMIKSCANSSNLYFFRANGEIISIGTGRLLEEQPPQGEEGGEEDKNFQNPNQLAARLSFRREQHHKATRMLATCIKEAGKTLNLVLKQHNFACFKGSVEKLDSDSMQVSLRDVSALESEKAANKNSSSNKLVSWIWELPSMERGHHGLKRRLGICTQRAKAVKIDGTERIFVSQCIGDKVFLYVKLSLIPRTLQEAIRREDEKGILKGFNSCETLLLLDIVHLDSVVELGGTCFSQVAVPSHYSNASALSTATSRNNNVDKARLLEELHQQVNTIAQAFGVIRERKAKAEAEASSLHQRENPQSLHYGSDGALLSTLRSLQKDLGEMWYATRRLIV